MLAFLIISAIIFLFLAILWNTDVLLNVVCKTGFFALAAWAFVLILQQNNIVIDTAEHNQPLNQNCSQTGFMGKKC